MGSIETTGSGNKKLPNLFRNFALTLALAGAMSCNNPSPSQEHDTPTISTEVGLNNNSTTSNGETGADDFDITKKDGKAYIENYPITVKDGEKYVKINGDTYKMVDCHEVDGVYVHRLLKSDESPNKLSGKLSDKLTNTSNKTDESSNNYYFLIDNKIYKGIHIDPNNIGKTSDNKTYFMFRDTKEETFVLDGKEICKADKILNIILDGDGHTFLTNGIDYNDGIAKRSNFIGDLNNIKNSKSIFITDEELKTLLGNRNDNILVEGVSLEFFKRMMKME